MSAQSRIRFTRKATLLAAAAGIVTFVTQAGADLTPEEIERNRQMAQTLAASGQCRDAIPVWEGLAHFTRAASDYMDAANCAIEIGEAQRAMNALWQALRLRDQLNFDEQVFALRSLGFQAESLDQWPRAAASWTEVADLTGTASDQLMAARALRMAGRTVPAQSRLMQIDFAQFEGAELAGYYDERAYALRDSQPGVAAAYMGRAIAQEDAGWRRYDRALMLQQAGQGDEALAEFRQALSLDPGNSDIQLSLAYALRERGENNEAADLFGRALASQPDRVDVREDMAYALKDAGRETDAAEAFRAVVDGLSRTGGDEEHLYRVRREITELERNVSGYAYMTWREEGAAPANGLNGQQSFGSLGAELNWRPDALYSNGKGVTLSTRAYAGFEPGSLSLDDDTAQMGTGVRWKPFSSQDFSLSAERLVALGDQARDDWLLRASYGWTDGYDWDPVRSNWNYTSLYADLAHIPGDNSYTGAYAQVRQGRRFRTGEGWAVTPYVTAVGQYYDDAFGDDTRFEAGAGVTVSRWMGQDRYHAYRRRVDFDMEYLTGLDDDGDAFMARIVFSY